MLDSRQFQIAIRKLADGLNYGTDRSPFRGAGVEFVQSRPYIYGDPIRSIDWRVTARTGKIHIKEYEAPKRMPVYLLIDTSASMMVSSQSRSKYADAVHIAGGVALACLDRISPVGVLGVGDCELHMRPSLSKVQILQWLHFLRTFRYDESTTLADRMRELVPSLTSKALCLVLSDLHDTQALQQIKRAGQRHDVCVLQLRDPAEGGLRGAGLFRAREAESGRAFVTHGRAQWLNQQPVEVSLKRAGIDHLVVETGQPFVHRLHRFFKHRDLLGRGAR
jgi:uncharacterized protein (DUF58 family)